MRGIELGHHGLITMEGEGLSLRFGKMVPVDDYGFMMMMNIRSAMAEF